jgi:hypothetical protein
MEGVHQSKIDIPIGWAACAEGIAKCLTAKKSHLTDKKVDQI